MKRIIIAALIITAIFSIAYAGGRATATWSAPTTYVDGSPLPASAIQEFRVYQGTSSRVYTTYYSVPANTTQFTISAPTGTHYFAMTVLTKEGQESDHSNEIVKYFPAQKPSACTFSWQ